MRQRGFTAIELIIVLVMLAIVAAILAGIARSACSHLSDPENPGIIDNITNTERF